MRELFFFSLLNISLFQFNCCVKCVQIWSFLWSVFSRIWTEYGPEKTPYWDTFHTANVKIKNCSVSVKSCICSTDCTLHTVLSNYVQRKGFRTWVFEEIFSAVGSSVYFPLTKFCAFAEKNEAAKLFTCENFLH